MSSSDVVGGALTGTATVDSTGRAVVAVTLAADALTEGAETMTLSVAGKTAAVTVNDTSTTPAPVVAPVATYAIAASATSVNEGSAVNFTLTTTNVPTGSTLAYTLGGTITAADVVGGALTGTVTVGFDGKAILPVTLSADALTEGAETITVSIATASSAAVTVNDTSLTPAPVAAAYTLSTTQDTTQAGTSLDDTWNGVIGSDGSSAAGTTLGVGDNINGAGGTGDKLALSISGTNTGAVNTAGFTLSNVEVLEISNYETSVNDNNLNMAQVTGLTTVNVIGSSATGDTVLTNVRALVGASMANGSGDLTLTYADAALAGTSDVQTLTVSGQTAGAFVAQPTATGVVETLSITSTGSANTLTATAAGATTINVTGDQNLTLTENMTNTLTRINASTFTGNLTFTNDESTSMSLTGGSGNDSFVFTTNFATSDSLDGGAGTLDNLTVGASVTSAALLANVTNVERLTLSGAGVNATLAANVSPTTFILSGAGANTLTLNTGYTNATTVNIGAGDTVTASGSTAALTVNASDAGMVNSVISANTTGLTDTLNLTSSSTTTTLNVLAQASGIDTITIVDAGDSATTGIATSAGNDVSITTGAITHNLTVNASSLDAGLTSGAASDTTNENLTFDGSGAASTRVLNVTGGGGLDTITGGAGNDILSGGAGNDSINGASGGADSISGGDGNDTINMGSALTTADTIDGGAGTDTLIVTALPAGALTNVTNVESLVFSGTGALSLAANVSFTSIDMDNGTEAIATPLTFATGYTNATTVAVDAGDSVTNTANIALTVTSTDAKMAGTTIAGGTGVDVLSITATANGAANLTLANLITGVETINLIDGGDATTGTVTAGFDAGITTGAYGGSTTVATTLTIDASTFDAGTIVSNVLTNDEVATVDASGITNTLVRVSVTGGGGADQLTGGAGNDIISGGDGNDTITLSSGGMDSALGGNGDDTFALGGALTFQDTIDGGAGTNTMTITSVVDADLANTSNIQTVRLAGTGTFGAQASRAGVATVDTNTTASAVDASAMTTAVTINARGNAINETLTGGTGADTFVFGGGTGGTATSGFDSLNASDVVAGGAGLDTLIINNGLTASVTTSATLDADTVTAVETVQLGTASGNGTTTAEPISLTLGDVTLATVQTITITAAGITDVRDTVTIANQSNNTVGGAATSGGTSWSIVGGAGNDTLTGGANNDTVSGGGGNDVFNDSTGQDQYTGGAGADTFNFALSAGTTSALPDTITDFTSGSDVITLAAGNTATTDGMTYDFTYKGAAASLGDVFGLLTGTGTGTTTRIGQYAINTSNNTLVLDSNGDGLIQGGDFALRLTSVAAIANGDLSITVTAGAAANQTILTGGGNDTITFSAITTNANINAGAGDDSINTTVANLTATDTINGGLGVDTLNISTAGTATLTTDTTLVGVERIVLGADSFTSLNLTGQTEAFNITTANGTNAVTLGTAGTTAGSLGSTVTGGTGADTVNAASYVIFAASSINGGAGADIVNITNADLTIVDAGFANHRLVETLGLTGASTAVLGTNATAAGITTVSTGNAATSITSTQAALAVTDTIGTAGVVLTLAGSANYTVTGTGTSTANTVTGTTSTGTLNITFADIAGGTDTAAVIAGTGNVTVTGAGTTDTITVTGLATANQVFVGNAGTSVNFNVTGTTGAQSISTGAGADIVNGGAGADTISTGTGNDTITIASTAEANGDVIDAGAGTDTVVLSAAVDFTNTTLVGGTGGIEAYIALVATTATFTGAQLSGAAISINESADTGNTALVINVAGGSSVDYSQLTFTALGNGNAWDAADTITITGGATATSIIGTSVADSITGGVGADTLQGGSGADTLTGGDGNDTFVFGSTAELINGTAFADVIAGGNGSLDVIQLTTQSGITIGNTLLFNAGISGVERITAGPSAAAISITLDTGNTGLSTSGITTIDLSGDTSATGTNVVSLTGVTGISSVVGSAGVDQFTVGATSTAVTLTGGAGADTYAVNATGNSGITFVYNALGQSVVAAGAAFTDGAAATAGDIITYGGAAGQTFRIDLSSLGIVALNSISTIAVGTAATNYLSGTSGVLALTRGTLAGGAFTAGAGADLLIQWDTNGATAGGIESVVFDGGAASATAAALVGVVTITIA